ncbi:type 1 periplasmic binding fold superfamily protein [Robertkochia sediminum]|uniref:type 1 periplasmic binding fold superfamily protein n=1 Tax=Robertkochia sediminum TaxID=2785326 RepID=UPI00193144E2|nr:type 1 periplasmic binding fold superfamily protein [Robertkochia sediminum]MBL7473223.1 type 1 periplasmic binding fold superfamily protein [Robertkochia sediminum]
MKNLINTAIALTLVLGMTSCSDDDTPEQINEEEFINEVSLMITETGTANTMTYTWTEGGTAPEPIVIDAEKTYEVEVSFLDSTNPNDIEDITEEVIAEADEHHVFFETSVSGLTIAASDNDFEDSMGNKLGVITNWTATGTTNGNVVVYLIHEPVTKTGTTRDDFGGETDVQVPFTVTVN